MADSALIDIRDLADEDVPRGPSSAVDDQLLGLEGPEARPKPESADSAVEKLELGENPKDKCAGISWPWSKRDRLKRDPSLDKVDEDLDQIPAKTSSKETSETTPTRRCPDYFGVRSYLHNFYDTRSPFKDPDVYEEVDDTRHLLNPSARRRRHCTAAWWKGFVFVGVLFLLVGIVCVLVGYLLPQRPILVGMVGIDKEVIDRDAIAYNYNLDACKLIGLILFCLGGLTLAVALMIPSFLYRYCDDERAEGGFALPIGCRDDEAPPLHKDPLLMVVPTTEKLTEIQPMTRQDDGGLLREGVVHYPGLE